MSFSPKRRLRVLVATAAAVIAGAAGAVALPALDGTAVAQAACGANSPHATVTGSSGAYVTKEGSTTVYSGSDYRAAVQAGVDTISSGQRVAVMASGNIGASTITIQSGKTFEGCGMITVGNRSGRGAIEAINTTDVNIAFLKMSGNPYFGLRFSGTNGLKLGDIDLTLSGGLGIRFDRDAAWNYNVTMNDVYVSGAGSHAVETWNIDGFNITKVTARNVGESGLLIQNSRNGWVGTVDGNNVGAGTGYATFRMANTNGKTASGGYATNIWVDNVISRGGGRGIFCVSQSGGVVIKNVDLASNGNNSVLIENCYNVSIRGGTVNGGGEVRLAARTEFANNKDIWMIMTVNNTSVRESPCGENTNWTISGNASMNVC